MSRIATHVETPEPLARPAYATCKCCHRTFHATSEDQFSVQLCEECFERTKSGGETIPCAHVRPRPYRPARD
jgi:hypothetical protein